MVFEGDNYVMYNIFIQLLVFFGAMIYESIAPHHLVLLVPHKTMQSKLADTVIT